MVLQLPLVKAVPAELVRGTDLIGESERVDPPLLFRSPPAVPGELDHAGLSAALDRDGAHEVRAPGSSVNSQVLDRPFRMGVQQLVDEPDHLDARNVSHEGDGLRVGSRGERDHIALELLGRAGAAEDLGVYGHGRNISTGRGLLGSTSPFNRTKLTGRSARGRLTRGCQ
jgi:hypothetical protein